ncbi:MAG: ABC transporter permease [Bacteroidales bacterium]|jgi:sodium transport system permease protein|nr:ABC transporter permease [Bacteroidales bacterium]
MKNRNNTWTIIRKEFARFFRDRQLVFTTVIMPGLLIYLIYSLMGVGIRNMESQGKQDLVTVRVENMPASMEPVLTLPESNVLLVQQPINQGDIDALQDKDLNDMLIRFPAGFDSLVANYSPQSGLPAPNIEIYYNSANNAVNGVYYALDATLTAYENSQANLFDVNRADGEEQSFDQASDDQMIGDILSKLLPMLIIMMLFSGTMAIAPSAIAGEKERGTIATLLVTPLRRNELALGKIVSLSSIALLSGISSFIGIALSLPNMIAASDESIDIPFNYTPNDYIALLLVILASVLVMASAVSLLSALAKDVKNAGTMITPFMLVVMLAGLLPMFQTGTADNLAIYLIPFYNAIEVMADVFAHSMRWTPVLITLVSDIAYTGIAVWGLTRMFNSEKVMFSK